MELSPLLLPAHLQIINEYAISSSLWPTQGAPSPSRSPLVKEHIRWIYLFYFRIWRYGTLNHTDVGDGLFFLLFLYFLSRVTNDHLSCTLLFL
uniref:Uncharacterized protein n=1 Tax=Nelumbo nucifera TaxID=4432 RepID=A0A822Z4I6_NELNU|nr:TPA_asm: hypothetical protein HUJ06_015567 [Nelumbo nucifera]